MITTVVALFAIMGVVTLPPVFLVATASMTPAERRRTAWMTGLAIAVVMVVSYFIGGLILEFFKIDLDAFRVAGALVVGSMAWGMITGRPSPLLETKGSSPAVIPLAIPKTAGPGAIALAVTMGVSPTGPTVVGDLLAILGVTAIALVAMFAARSSHEPVPQACARRPNIGHRRDVQLHVELAHVKVLKEASEQPGVQVSVYVDGNKADAQEVKAQMPKASVYRSGTLPDGRQIVSHAKFIVIDHSLMLITSANFSYSAENLNVEFGLLVDDPTVAESVEEQMFSKRGLLYEAVT